MSTTLAFDVYGTLIDTNGVLSLLEEFIGDNAKSFSQTWRDKQLEYSFRRGLMKKYDNFAVCTAQALDFTCAFHKISLEPKQKKELLEIYRVLPAFSDVKMALLSLKIAGFRLYAFSNGKADSLDTLLTNAGIKEMFLGIISVDDIKTFKPSPDVYSHFLSKSESTKSDAWLISSNPFDVIGSINAGMKSAWVQRSPDAVFDPWGINPTLTVNSLLELVDKISIHKN